ncbi:hypothetical protein SAMN06313486_10533 [Epsilonproteobacteria bacterium SCGC AD-308-P11]|nr:hypothetical protein SAMN06313486_10533 [Epsilonproteobacteria bacterium SCGC AD-308-P11]
MAKKKKSVELSDKNISFNIKDLTYKVIRYYPTSMTLDVMVFEKEVKQGMQTLAFAHIPKEIKKIIKPN